MKEMRWELRYRALKNGKWIDKICYPRSEEKKAENLAKIAASDTLQYVSCKKMYPFDMWNNQHNFELIANICYNRMRDMEDGEIKFDQAEYDRLSALREKADRLFCMMTGPITWLVGEDLAAAKELSMMARNHRAQACIENRRADLERYC